MSNLRTGTFGNYYGSFKPESEPLSRSEMEVNVKYIYSYLLSKGWTIQSISALCGNLQAESSINPGRWQSDNVGSTSNGYGLVQWTPATKYFEWCSANGITDYSEMDSNLKRILYELENNIQWIATNSYNFSFKEFSTSTDSPSNLAVAFLLNYERPADQSESVQAYRGSLANSWYTYLSGVTPSSPSNGRTRKRRKFNFILFRRKLWINKIF